MIRVLAAILSCSIITSVHALSSSGVDEITGQLKSYQFSDIQKGSRGSSANIGVDQSPLFLRAFDFEGDDSIWNEINVSQTIPWPVYRPQIKPGEIWARMRFNPSWKPIRDYDGYLSSLKIKWDGNLLGETRRLHLLIDTNFIKGVLNKNFDECGRHVIDDHGDAIYLQIHWKDDSGDIDAVRARKKCVSSMLSADARRALDQFLLAFPFYLESQECYQQELIPIVAELFGRVQTDCSSNQKGGGVSGTEFVETSRTRIAEMLSNSSVDLGSPPPMTYDTSTVEVCQWAMPEWKSTPGSWAKYAESRGLSLEGCQVFLRQ